MDAEKLRRMRNDPLAYAMRDCRYSLLAIEFAMDRAAALVASGVDPYRADSQALSDAHAEFEASGRLMQRARVA